MKKLAAVLGAILGIALWIAGDSAMAVGVGDVTIHLNGGDDVAYIGQENTLEIWYSNDDRLTGISTGLEINYGGPYRRLSGIDPGHTSPGPYHRSGNIGLSDDTPDSSSRPAALVQFPGFGCIGRYAIQCPCRTEIQPAFIRSYSCAEDFIRTVTQGVFRNYVK